MRSISLPCPFHVFGCKEEFHHDRKQQWVEHSLSHFQRRERGGRGLVRVEPPDSCLCHFCKTNFSSSSGTACWKDYMNHVCDCGLDGRVPLDSKFIEYLWLNRLISYRNYRTIRPLRRSPSETNMAQDFALIESRSSASSIWETSRSDKQVSTSETQIDRKIRGASVGTSAKQEQWRRRICRKIIVFMLWKREQDLCLPTEFWSSPASFKFSDVLRISPLDKIKGLFETYSGREWDWWPFDPPAKPLASGKVRIRWQCVGELNPIMPCISADRLRPVAINAGLMHRGILPGSAKPRSMRIQQLGMKAAMPHLSQRAQPLVTHTLGAPSQDCSPATARNQPESPLIYIPPHKPVISRIPTKAAIRKICTFYSASTKEARSYTVKFSPPNARTMKPSSTISDKTTAASGASFASGFHRCNSPIAIS